MEGCQPGSLIIDISSINPLVSLKIAAAGNSRDVDFLDAPASSGSMTANRIVA
jgi:3-hydroxyisobutyrate dehydrogenase-like beta-hydroxyacid dehydrogenase